MAAADCLVPGIGELIGGSQREERARRAHRAHGRSWGSTGKDYWWYLDLRRYGSCRHAGYGLGFERLIMYLTGVANIRDVLPHPEDAGQRGLLSHPAAGGNVCKTRRVSSSSHGVFSRRCGKRGRSPQRAPRRERPAHARAETG